MVAATRTLLLITLLTSVLAATTANNGLRVIPGSSVTHLHAEDIASEEGTYEEEEMTVRSNKTKQTTMKITDDT